jgi:antirestriction protein ArdC
VNHKELYERVTAQVVARIEAGAGTWSMPWRAIANIGQPVNATTHRAYRGGNHMWLAMVAQANGWGGGGVHPLV